MGTPISVVCSIERVWYIVQDRKDGRRVSVGSESKLKPMYVSTTRVRRMVGVKECSMEDEDCSQTTLFNFQEVRIQQS